jgi:hypothetical protein
MEKKRLYVSILLFSLLLSSIGAAFDGLNVNSNRDLNDPTDYPQEQSYSTNSSDSVTGPKVSIQQAFRNESITTLTNTKTMISVPAPLTSNYKTSSVYLGIDDIQVANHSITFEEYNASGWYHNFLDTVNPAYASFKVIGDCYLDNVSFYLRGLGGVANFSVYILNSSWSVVNNRNEPYGTVANPNLLCFIKGVTTAGWYSNDTNYFLDNSKTDNNTWFVGLRQNEISGVTGRWWYNQDGVHGDLLDESLSYKYNVGTWTLIIDTHWIVDSASFDFITKVGLTLNDNTPSPLDINLQVNNTNVQNNYNIEDAGNWTTTNKFSSTTGFLKFNFTALWYTYSFKVNVTQVNYTKSDFTVTSGYTVKSANSVLWNTSVVVNALDYRLNNNTINFTIPVNWNTLNVRNITESQTYITKSNTTHHIITAFGKGITNSTWWLTADSLNLLTDLKMGKNGIETKLAYSDETLQFNVTFLHQITGFVNLTVYNPSSIDEEMNFTKEVNVETLSKFVDLGNWVVGTTIKQPGEYRVQVKWNNQTDAAIIDSTIVIALRTANSWSPASGLEYFSTDQPFNISIRFLDAFTIAEDTNITSATIKYDLGAGEKTEIQNNPDKSYNLTIDPSVFDVGEYFIPIEVEKQYYANFSMEFALRVVNDTIITPFLPMSTLNVIRGANATYYFNYNQTNNIWADGIEGAVIHDIHVNSSFIWLVNPSIKGNYSIMLNTSAINVGSYICEFDIGRTCFKTQPIIFTVIVNKASTSVVKISSTQEIWRKGGLNVTSTFTLNDISNSKTISEMATGFISVRNGSNPTQLWNVLGWDSYAWEVGSGVYGVNISIRGLNFGWYSAIINVSYTPNYIFSTLTIQFYVRGNMTEFTISDINNNQGVSLPKASGRYNIYNHAPRIGVVFNITDSEYADQLLKDLTAPSPYVFQYWTYLNKTQTLTQSITFDNNILQKNTGYIDLPAGLAVGDYNITIIVGMFNYENVTYVFDFRVIAEHTITIIMVNTLVSLTQSATITLYFKIEYTNGTVFPLTFAEIDLANNVTVTVLSDTTNTTGGISFDFTVPTGTYKQIKLTISYDGVAYGIDLGSQGFDINVDPAPGIPEWILYVIFAAIIGVVSVIGIQKGVIAPRKRRYTELLVNTASMFEDAINLQHLLVIYKATGTCIYFKSFGLEQIDPDLIAGFLSAAQSFVKESMSSDGLSEMKSGDNSLLSSDGEKVRITLVLSKPASQFMRSNLSRLIMTFESKYASILLNWKGQLAIFKDTAQMIDEIIGTSVILPHNITTDVKAIKSVSSVLAKSLLKIARDLTSGQRQFFFIAQLVSEAKSKLKRDPPEILIGLQDLLKGKVIVPVDLSRYEAQPVSEQELQVLAQRVATLPDLTSEEKENLVQSLVDMSAAEREVALTSLQQGKKIISDVSKNLVSTKQFANVKDAKVEIANLLKQAAKNLKNQEFDDALRCYETAEVTANQWKLTTEAKKYRDLALDAQIKKFNLKINTAKKEGPKLVKMGEIEKATELYKEANESASSLFKLGFTVYEKDVKYFNKLLIDTQCTVTEKAGGKVEVAPVCDDDKESLLKVERELLKMAAKQEKNKEIRNSIATYTELIIVADKLFKFGVVTATADIKKYRAKVAELKNTLLKMKANGMQVETEEQLNDQKSQLLNIALDSEKKGDFLKAVVAYQQVLNIYNMLGDAENSARLEEKIRLLVIKIPDIKTIIKSILDSADKNLKVQNYKNANAEYQYAKGLCQATNDRDSLKTIELKLITIPTNK